MYFAPVAEYHFERWEYYQVDLEILCEISEEVIVCHSLADVLRAIYRVEIVYCWWWHRSTLVILLAKVLGRPVLTTGAVHMYDYSGASGFYQKSLIYRLATRLSLWWSDANLFISNDQLLQITSECNVTNPVLVYSSLSDSLQNALHLINTEKLQTGPRDPSLTRPHFKFITLCWHTEQQYIRKGVFETLAALCEPSESFTYEWTIIGGAGDGLDILKKRVRALGLERSITILVDLDRTSINELLASSDLYLQPSWSEGFGNAVLEAMTVGTPALVSRYTAQPEVVGDCGFVCLEITQDGIRRSIEEFASLDDSQIIELRHKVAERSKNAFSYSNRLKSMRNVVETVIAEKK